MVLPFEGFRGYSIIEFAVTITPVGQVTVKGGFSSLDIDVSTLGVRNLWESFVQQYFAVMAILFSFFVEYRKGSVLNIVEGIPTY
jgi:hypothetical protein